MTRRTLAILAGVGAAAIVAAIGIAVTLRGDFQPSDTAAPRADVSTYVAAAMGTTNGGTNLRAELRELMANDDFRAEAAQLRDEHQAATDAWWDEYGDAPRSDEARAALETLRDEQRAAMVALLEKYGVDTSSMEERRQAAQQARDRLEELMANDDFRADLNAVRDEREKAMDAWWDEYGDAPRSDEARAALKTLRDEAQADLDELLDKYGLDLPAGGLKKLGGLMGREGPAAWPGGLGGHGGGSGGKGCDIRDDAATVTPSTTRSL